MVIPSVSAPHFVSVTPSMSILFLLLRRIKISTLWSFFFLSFMCFANCILGILSFWAHIHLSVSAHHVCSFVICIRYFNGDSKSQKILDSCYADPRRTQMPAQATIPSKILNYHRCIKQDDKTKLIYIH